MHYHFKVHKEGKGYWAQCLEIAYCHTQTDGPGTLDDLRRNCEEVLNLVLNEPPESKELIPLPDKNLDGNKRLMKVKADDTIAFAMVLRQSRLKARMTQVQAAQKLGMKNINSYQRLERKANPTLTMINKLHTVFPKMELEYLFQ
jgi:predicted RNase H-like HicB family nuclease/DNA-binding XRE family transcriptional regulator